MSGGADDWLVDGGRKGETETGYFRVRVGLRRRRCTIGPAMPEVEGDTRPSVSKGLKGWNMFVGVCKSGDGGEDDG